MNLLSFINGREKQGDREPIVDITLYCSLFKPIAYSVVGPEWWYFCLQPQDCSNHLSFRLPREYVLSYLGMFKYMNCSVGCFVYALILIDRLQEYHPEFSLHPRNVHRLILAANVVSAKYLDDFFYKNSFYANVGGVPLTLLNSLEIEFLTLLDFNAHVEQ